MPKTNFIPIEQINYEDKRYIFRHSFDVLDLENSIEFDGLIYPPILLKLEQEEKYIIISGYRRLLACRNIEKRQVECLVYEKQELTDQEYLKISIAENTKRKNLKPIEIAEALIRIQKELNLNEQQLAEQFGDTFGIANDVATVQNYLKLNSFDEETKNFLTKETKENIEFEIANIEDKEDRDAVVDFVKNNKEIKKRQLNQLIEKSNQIKEKENAPSYKGIFKQDALMDILKDEKKNKINTFLSELENKIDPEKRDKQQKLLENLKSLKESLKEIDLANSISFKKNFFGDNKIKINLEISNTKQLLQFAQVLIQNKENKKILEETISL